LPLLRCIRLLSLSIKFLLSGALAWLLRPLPVLKMLGCLFFFPPPTFFFFFILFTGGVSSLFSLWLSPRFPLSFLIEKVLIFLCIRDQDCTAECLLSTPLFLVFPLAAGLLFAFLPLSKSIFVPPVPAFARGPLPFLYVRLPFGMSIFSLRIPPLRYVFVPPPPSLRISAFLVDSGGPSYFFFSPP